MIVAKKELRPEATPHRVYLFCRLVDRNNYSSKELKTLLCPPDVATDPKYQNVYRLCSDLGLISDDNGVVKLNIPSESVRSPVNFRRALMAILFKNKETLFYKFTKFYLAQDLNVTGFDSYAELTRQQTGELLDISRNDLLAWRFWMHFLGLGFLHEEKLIFNTSTCLSDFLDLNSELKNKVLEIDQFFNYLLNYCPVMEDCIKESKISPSLSIGLRVLKKTGRIVMERVNDAPQKWTLAKWSANVSSEEITGIRIAG